MTEHDFNIVITRLKKLHENEQKLNALGINLIELNDSYHYIINTLFESIFGIDKADVIGWYMYEYRKGKMQISSSKTGEVLYDLDKKGELWKYLND